MHVQIAVGDWGEVEAELQEVLSRREPEIREALRAGFMDGNLQFLALLAEAKSIVHRRRHVAYRR